MFPHLPKKPNILLISLDCVRYDNLSCYGYKDVSTPTIDSIAYEGVRFSQAISPVPFTPPSHASMLTGLYPFNHGVRLLIGQLLSPGIPTFGTLLKQVGFITGGFPSVFMMNRKSGFDNGFDVFDDNIENIREGFRGPWRPGDLTTNALLKFIKQNIKKPFAAFVHYFDPHDYNPGSHDAIQVYKRKITELDGLIKRVVHTLKKLRLWEKTLVVITADHGDSFGEHGEYGHGKALYDSTLRVPLIFRWPQQLPKGRFIEQQVRLIDILPTILDLIGCLETVQLQGIVFDGVSLLPTIEGKDLNLPAYSETSPVQLFTGDLLATKDFKNVEIMCLRQNGKKYIFKNTINELPIKPKINIGNKVNRFLGINIGEKIDFFLNRFFIPVSPSKEKEELYDLVKDSAEKRNLASAYPDLCAQMKSDLNTLVATKRIIQCRELANRTEEEMTIIRKHLKNLGYL